MTSASSRAGTTAATAGQTRGLGGLVPVVALARQPEAAAADQQIDPDQQRQAGDDRRSSRSVDIARLAEPGERVGEALAHRAARA